LILDRYILSCLKVQEAVEGVLVGVLVGIHLDEDEELMGVVEAIWQTMQ
jgi:hypothetical protein